VSLSACSGLPGDLNVCVLYIKSHCGIALTATLWETLMVAMGRLKEPGRQTPIGTSPELLCRDLRQAQTFSIYPTCTNHPLPYCFAVRSRRPSKAGLVLVHCHCENQGRPISLLVRSAVLDRTADYVLTVMQHSTRH
jgi:hypothetical protein